MVQVLLREFENAETAYAAARRRVADGLLPIVLKELSILGANRTLGDHIGEFLVKRGVNIPMTVLKLVLDRGAGYGRIEKSSCQDSRGDVYILYRYIPDVRDLVRGGMPGRAQKSRKK